MALIKPSAEITDISGKFGGVYFSRDKTGLHISAMPRVIKKEPTPAQKDQRNFYGNLKREENARAKANRSKLKDAQSVIEEYEQPETENTALILSLTNIWARRTPTLFQPEQMTMAGLDFYEMYIKEQIEHHPDFWNLPSFLTKDFLILLARKFYLISRYTWGVVAGESAIDAMAFIRLYVLEAISARNAIIIFGTYLDLVPVLVVAGFLIFWKVYDFIQGVDAHTDFTKGRVAIRLKSNWFWGQLVARPSKKMFDFCIISPIPFFPFKWFSDVDYPLYRKNWFSFLGTWQTAEYVFPFWYVNSWGEMECYQRGYAFKIRENVYRLEAPESQIRFWEQPIGWQTDSKREKRAGHLACEGLAGQV